MYVQVGDFHISRELSTIPIAQISCNTVFSKSQNARKAGTLCMSAASAGLKYIALVLFVKYVKFMFFEKAAKNYKIFTDNLTVCSNCQIDGEDFINFCGLLRKHELCFCDYRGSPPYAHFGTWKKPCYINLC